MAQAKARHALLTGPPGVGKTTLTKKICQALKERLNLPVAGFYTEEMRQDGRRVGFDIVDISTGARKPLARIGGGSGPKVGQYTVQLADFESVALVVVGNKKQVAVIIVDEIGKMELFSKKFEAQAAALFDGALPVLATIPISKPGARPLALVERLRNRPDCRIFQMEKSNRDNPKLIEDILNVLVPANKK